MALANNYVQAIGQFDKFFSTIQEGQAPEKFTQKHLKDIGFASSSWRSAIPLLKALGFLTSDGTPTPRYHDYRDKSKAKRVMADALKDAYSDLFVLKARPEKNKDSDVIVGKFKSTFNTNNNLANLMANTFFALLGLADLDAVSGDGVAPPGADETGNGEEEAPPPPGTGGHGGEGGALGLHYNIQVHLPATKDIEVYNSIFKALKEHLIA